MPPIVTVLSPVSRGGDGADRQTPSSGEDVVAIARELGVLSAAWLHTGCIYDAVPASAYSVLMMPVRPDPPRRHNAYHAWWPALAPSDSLYAAYCEQRISWPAFAQTYLGELQRQRNVLLRMIASHVLALPSRYSGVTFIGFRHAPGGDETRVRCPRRVLLSWLLHDQGAHVHSRG